MRRLNRRLLAVWAVLSAITVIYIWIDHSADHHGTAHASSAVTVIDGENARTVPFEAGKVGAERTEVVSGLREGQRVAIPTSGDAR